MSSISSGTTLTTALVQTADTSGVLQLQTNGTTTAVTIDTSQNVGIGTTPSAWQSGCKTLQVGSTAKAFLGDGGNGVGFFGSNSYNDGANKFALSGYATQYYQDTTGGTHVWRTSTASGSANGTITWLEGMRIDSSGNFGLGVTPSGWSGRTAFQFGAAGQCGSQFGC